MSSWAGGRSLGNLRGVKEVVSSDRYQAGRKSRRVVLVFARGEVSSSVQGKLFSKDEVIVNLGRM